MEMWLTKVGKTLSEADLEEKSDHWGHITFDISVKCQILN
jgi:hypothetical protein